MAFLLPRSRTYIARASLNLSPRSVPNNAGALLVANGTLSAPVEATYALADYRDAIANAARNERNGKVLFALQ